MKLIQEVRYFLEDTWDSTNSTLSKYQPGILLIGSIAGTVTFMKYCQWRKKSEKAVHKRIGTYFFSLLRKLPSVQKEIETKLGATKKDLIHSIHQYDKKGNFILQLPKEAYTFDQIMALAKEYDEMATFDVDGGKVSGTVYTDRAEKHLDLLTAVFKKYAYSNPLHPDVFPGVRKMEAEVIRIITDLYHGTAESCGTMTSGGTESIILACFAHKNRAIANGINHPVIVCPVTAHAAFDKAADLFGIRIRHVPVHANQKVDLKAYKNAICSETCMLVGSVPNFPSGTADDIIAISQLGLKYNIPVHVDACLGGMLIPFMEEAGFPMPLFDFRLPGVSSISCDTHKYGYAPKGSSVVMYKAAEYLHFQYFSVTEWPGGIYATPTIAGSRCGSAIALTWATLLYFGRDEYIERTKKIVGAARKIVAKVRSADLGLEIMGDCDVSVVALKSNEFNIYAVADALGKKGWNINALQNPHAIHLCLTFNQATDKVVDDFVGDLKEVTDVLKKDPTKGNNSKSAAIYGMAAQVPDMSLIDEVTAGYLDACYSVNPGK
uniref:Sphingosine-1-phosphate lyase n=1 Tax=Rhabditophanes sp. KR3021 TaxID=114890 RepID=A0AC35UF34_9BILA